MLIDRQTGELTGYPSIDKPWLKYYTDEQINAPLPECSLYEYLWECNKDHLDNYALNYFGRKITYRKLFSMIDEAASAFIALGVKEKEIVPIITVSTVTSVVCFYALNKIGAVSDYLNVLSEEGDLQRFFEEVNAKTVVTLDLFEEKVVNAAQKCDVDTVITFGINHKMPIAVDLGYRLKTVGKHHANRLPKNVLPWKTFIRGAANIEEIVRHKNPDEMCLLTHTGGTTGDPKAVMLSDKAMNIVADYYKQCLGFSRGEIWANVMIPFVVYGLLTCLHMPLAVGLTTVVIPKLDVQQWTKYFKKYKFNYVLAVPSYVSVFFENKEYENLDLSTLKMCGVGGDGMTPEKERKLNSYFTKHGADIEILKGYGMSEVCATAVTGLVGVNKIGSVGIPLIHNNIMIYDSDEEKELPYGMVGEICIQSPSRMIGYMNNAEATDALFHRHPDGSEWLHSGDLGYIDEEGFLFIAGRMKRVILTTKDGVAYKVFPNVPEKTINTHESVISCCVVGAKDGDNQVLRAHIVISSDDMERAPAIEKEIRKICDEQLPSYSRPTFYVFSESIPLTPAGKVDYRALETMPE